MFKVTVEGQNLNELKRNMRCFLESYDSTDKIPVGQSAEFVAAAHSKKPENYEGHIPVLPSVVANDYGVDSRGIPWDERIHAVTQGKKTDGSWRYRRGVEDAQIKSIEEELLAKSTSPVLTPATPSVPAAPVLHNIPVVHVAPPVQVAPAVQPVHVPIPAPNIQVPAAHNFKTFKDTLIPTMAKLVREGKLTQDYVNQLCEHFGVDLIFKVNDQQLEEIFNNFVEHGMIVKVG